MSPANETANMRAGSVNFLKYIGSGRKRVTDAGIFFGDGIAKSVHCLVAEREFVE